MNGTGRGGPGRRSARRAKIVWSDMQALSAARRGGINYRYGFTSITDRWVPRGHWCFSDSACIRHAEPYSGRGRRR